MNTGNEEAVKTIPEILVIGGMNLDILGTAHTGFVAEDSLPGRIVRSPGGVARNIAALLRRQHARVELICPLGKDSDASLLADACRSLGIGLSHAIQTDLLTPAYLAIHDATGDMVCAINDMQAMEAMTPERLQEHIPGLPAFDACVLDANLLPETLHYLADTLPFPLVADPVSAAKCRRLVPILGRLHAIKPNLLEAQALTGATSCEDAAAYLLDQGVQQVFVSLGKEGVYYADISQRGYIKAPQLPRVRLTGAGDAMTAGITMGIAQKLPVREVAEWGVRAATEYLKSLIEQDNSKN